MRAIPRKELDNRKGVNIMQIKDQLTIEKIQFNDKNYRTLDEILDSAELGILLTIGNEKK